MAKIANQQMDYFCRDDLLNGSIAELLNYVQQKTQFKI